MAVDLTSCSDLVRVNVIMSCDEDVMLHFHAPAVLVLQNLVADIDANDVVLACLAYSVVARMGFVVTVDCHQQVRDRLLKGMAMERQDEIAEA